MHNLESSSFTLRFMLTMACLVIVLAGIKAASVVLIPFLLSVFIAITINPVISKLVIWRIPRFIAILLVLSVLLVIGFSCAAVVGQSFNDFSTSLPEYQQQLMNQFHKLVNKLALFNIEIDKNMLSAYFDPAIAMKMVGNLLSGFGGVMTNLFLILLTVIFVLFEVPDVKRKVHIALHDPEMKLKHIDKFLDSVKDYVAIKAMVSLLTASCVGVLLWILEIDYLFLWSVLAFFLNFIPNIGSIIAAVPAVLLALVLQGPAIAGMAAIGYVSINTLVGNVIEPRYMGKGLGLSTLAVFLSLIFWGWLLGSVGMLLSVPLTMIVKIALEANEESQWLAVLLGPVNK